MELFWIYLTNSVLLINHEIDSAYWKEWKLFGLPGGISGFLILHFPLLFLVLYGMILVYEKTYTGMIFSLALGMAGIFAFMIHMFFIRKGRTEFKAPISLFILVATLLVSIVQVVVTAICSLGGIFDTMDYQILLMGYSKSRIKRKSIESEMKNSG